MIQGDAKTLIELFRAEKDPAMKKVIRAAAFGHGRSGRDARDPRRAGRLAMKSTIAFVIAAMLCLPAGAVDAPASIENARIELRAGVSPAAALDGVGRGKTAEWVGWSVQAVADARDVCCFTDELQAPRMLAVGPRQLVGHERRSSSGAVRRSCTCSSRRRPAGRAGCGVVSARLSGRRRRTAVSFGSVPSSRGRASPP